VKLLEDRVAVITGAGHPKGIGKATAHMFLEHGGRVVLLDLDESAARKTASELDPTLANVSVYRCDISKAQDCAHVAERILTEVSPVIDVLVNNAGVTQKVSFEEMFEDDFDRIVGVNLKGMFLLSKALLPGFSRRGSIINISSLSAQNGGGIFGGAHYCAAKAGVLGLTRAMAKEFGPRGVRVNAVAPGLITTDFSRTGRSDESKDEAAKDWPLGRAGRPQEIAGACLFLASQLSSYMTGSTLDVNGGAYMR